LTASHPNQKEPREPKRFAIGKAKHSDKGQSGQDGFY